MPPTSPPKALIFDLMGTCTNWYSPILSALESAPPLPSTQQQQKPNPSFLPQLAKDWRASFFQEIHKRFEAGESQEDIDVTHRRVLDGLLEVRGIGGEWGEDVRGELVGKWHCQVAWPDAITALERLKNKFFIVVLAHGTTRLQLDIVQSSGLPFHTLLSSQLLGLTKPDPAIYLKAAELLQLQPEECMMVAAHAYDLRGAKKVGFQTAYIHRSTEDLDEDMT